MAWLMRDAEVLAVLEARRPGWRGRVQGALVLRRPWAVHTLTLPAGLDVAWCTPADPLEGLRVVKVVILGCRRVAVRRPGAEVAVVASAGAFERWDLKVGDRLEIKGAVTP